MVTPIDKKSTEGRLILPQAGAGNWIVAVGKETELEETLETYISTFCYYGPQVLT